jgi:hypothetical protein
MQQSVAPRTHKAWPLTLAIVGMGNESSRSYAGKRHSSKKVASAMAASKSRPLE